jgi:hypothetical protein
MKRLLVIAALVALAISVIAVTTSAGAKRKPAAVKTIHLIEHATTDTTTDTEAPGDSVGDILTFANDVFNAANTKKVGTDNGFCIRTVAPGAYECVLTNFLARGQITVEGPFFDTKNSVWAITGGTGAYKNARGWMELKSRAGGTEFDFIYHLTS